MADIRQIYGETTNLAQALAKTGETLRRSLNTSTLCYIKSIIRPFDNTFGIAELVPVAVKKDMPCDKIIGYFFTNTVAVNDFVLASFTDTDFRPVIAKPGRRQEIDGSPQVHAKSFAVIVPLK